MGLTRSHGTTGRGSIAIQIIVTIAGNVAVGSFRSWLGIATNTTLPQVPLSLSAGKASVVWKSFAIIIIIIMLIFVLVCSQETLLSSAYVSRIWLGEVPTRIIVSGRGGGEALFSPAHMSPVSGKMIASRRRW